MKTQSLAAFMGFTMVAAAVAASAAGASLALTLPVWAMFIGWVAFYTRGTTVRDGLENLGCVLLGMALGMGAALTIAVFRPAFGFFALPVVVFGVAMIVVSLRAVPVLNNLLCYFLGLIAYFASHQEPSLEAATPAGPRLTQNFIHSILAINAQPLEKVKLAAV